jgi:hypothetical protein
LDSELLNYKKLLVGFLAVMMSGIATADDLLPAASYRKPDVDLSRYTKLLITPLDLSDVKVLRPPLAKDDQRSWVFKRQDRRAVERLFSEIISDELTKNDGYQVVEELDDDVLQVEIEILSIMPSIRPGRSPMANKIVTLGSGDVVGTAELRDSKTRELLLLLEGEKTIGKEYKVFNRENNLSNIKHLFSTWGKRLRALMDLIHDKE